MLAELDGDRLRLICLCQGAARHYVHGDRGVADFELWGFFEEVRGHPFRLPPVWTALLG
jgi:hypothetical protein